jgi:hypothetical protein
MKQQWGTLVSLARKYRYDKYALIFLFGPMVFRSEPDMNLARAIAAFALFDELSTIQLPTYSRYEHFRVNQCPDAKYLTLLAKPARIPPPPEEFADIPNLSGKLRRQVEQRRSRHEQKSEDDCEALSRDLLSLWPCAEPELVRAGAPKSFLVDTEKALEAIRPEWKRLYENMVFGKHLDEVQTILSRRHSDDTTRPPPLVIRAQDPLASMRHSRIVPLLHDLTHNTTAGTSSQAIRSDAAWPKSQVIAPSRDMGYNPWSSGAKNTAFAGHARPTMLQTNQWSTHAETVASIQELQSIVEPYTDSESRIKQRYGHDLLQSLQAFETKTKTGNLSLGGQAALEYRDPECLMRYLGAKVVQVTSSLACHGAQGKTEWLRRGLLLPIMTPVTLLEQLRSTTVPSPPDSVRWQILNLGITITRVQKQLRLNTLALKGDDAACARYTEELKNVAHANWIPEQYPDWLLLEIEADMLIRPGQVDVAMATILPPSGANSVLQMNMGQGITPPHHPPQGHKPTI